MVGEPPDHVESPAGRALEGVGRGRIGEGIGVEAVVRAAHAGVDVIGADRLDALQAFLAGRAP